jgi:ketosteroid isomerase-like protein
MRALALIFVLFVAACSGNKYLATTKGETEIINSMIQAAKDWNEGNLDAFMDLYDSAATFMLPSGPVGLAGMKDNYQKGFFDGKMPRQNLRYEEMVVRPLGRQYALLTGKFVLYGNNLKERSGRYSLVFIQRKNGWRILHDHSS